MFFGAFCRLDFVIGNLCRLGFQDWRCREGWFHGESRGEGKGCEMRSCSGPSYDLEYLRGRVFGRSSQGVGVHEDARLDLWRRANDEN